MKLSLPILNYNQVKTPRDSQFIEDSNKGLGANLIRQPVKITSSKCPSRIQMGVERDTLDGNISILVGMFPMKSDP